MPALKKSEIRGHLIFLLTVAVVAFILSSPLSAQTDQQAGIRIIHANGLIVNGIYRLDADLDYQLSDESINALLHGVSLQIDIEMRVKMKRVWLWDKTIKDTVLSHQLEHHPLSGNFVVKNLATQNLDQFQNLAEALEYLGEIKNYPLIAEDKIEPGNKYLVQIQARLNKQSLPAPLRPLAYLSSKWHITSPRQEWAMQ